MSEVRLSPRFAALLVILALIMVFGCQTKDGGAPPTQTQTDTAPPAPVPAAHEACSSGNKSKNKPIICVDNTGKDLTAEPNPAPSWDFEKKKDKDEPSSRTVKVRWIAKTTTNLQIEFYNENCVKKSEVVCDGLGECTAKIRSDINWNDPNLPKDKDGNPYLQCTYKMMATDVPDPDADLVVNPCCW